MKEEEEPKITLIDVPPPVPNAHSSTLSPALTPNTTQLQPPFPITLQPPPLPPPLSCQDSQDLPPLPQPPPPEAVTKTPTKETPGRKELSPRYVPPPELPPPPQPLVLPTAGHPPSLKQLGKTTSTLTIGGSGQSLKVSAKVRRRSVMVSSKDQHHTSPPPPAISSPGQSKAQARRLRASSNYHGSPFMMSTPMLSYSDGASEAPPPVVKLFQDELSVMTALEKVRAPMYEPGASRIFDDFIGQLQIPSAYTLTPRAERLVQEQSTMTTTIMAGGKAIPEDIVMLSNFAPVKSSDFFADPIPQNLSINPSSSQQRYGDEGGDGNSSDRRKKSPQKGGVSSNNEEDGDNNNEDDEISKTFSKRPGHAEESEIARSLRSSKAVGTTGSLIPSKDAKKSGAEEEENDSEAQKNVECSCEVDQETQMAVVKPVVLKSLLTDELKVYDAIQEKLQKKHKYVISLPPDYNTKVTIELTEAGTILNAVNEVLKTYKAGPVILKNAPEAYLLYMADDAGLPETDFPAPDVTRRIIDMQCSTFALYENPMCIIFLLYISHLFNTLLYFFSVFITNIIYIIYIL